MSASSSFRPALTRAFLTNVLQGAPRGGAASFRKAVVSAVVACFTAAHVFSAALYGSPRFSNLYV
jgi:hypothetical protein